MINFLSIKVELSGVFDIDTNMYRNIYLYILSYWVTFQLNHQDPTAILKCNTRNTCNPVKHCDI